MATFKKPVVYDEKTGTHDEARDGQVLTPDVVPVDSSGGNVLGKSDEGLYLRPEDLVSKEGGNLLSIGDDGKLHASYEAPDAPSPVSTDAGNILTEGKDHAAYLAARDVLSTDETNLLRAATSDGKVILTAEDVQENLDLVSTEGTNYLRYDSSKHKLVVNGNDILSNSGENLLTIGADGKVRLDPDTVTPISPVSKDAGNYLRSGTDGGGYIDGNDILSNGDSNLLSISPVDKKIEMSRAAVDEAVASAVADAVKAIDPLAPDEGNLLRHGENGGVYADGNDLLSNGAVNLLTIDPVDKKIRLTREDLLSGLYVVSTDDGNLIKYGSDNGAYLSADGIIADDDPLLYVDGLGRVATEIGIEYNPATGDLIVTGAGGDTVGSVSIPTTTSVLKGVHLLKGMPSATGDAITGDYHFSIQAGNGEANGWVDAEGVTVQGTKGMGSSATIKGDYKNATVVRAAFNSMVAQGNMAGGAATLTFDDGSTIVVDNATTVSAQATFTPAVGLVPGVYLDFVFLLAAGGISDVYVDVTSLMDVYIAGQGISISGSRVVSVRLGPGLKFDESGNVIIDTDWLAQFVDDAVPDVTAGNGITVNVDGDTVTISTNNKPGGGILSDSTGNYIDESWLNQKIDAAIPDVTAGNGVNVEVSGDTATVSTKNKPDGGILVDASGNYIDEEWLARFIDETVPDDKPVTAGAGIKVEDDGTYKVSALMKPGGGITSDVDGLYVDWDAAGTWLCDEVKAMFPAGTANGITISWAGCVATVAAALGAGGGLEMGTGGNANTIVIDEDWLKNFIDANVPTPQAGNGISVTVQGLTATISTKQKANGGILADASGIYIDTEWLAANTLDIKAGNGITVSKSGNVATVSAKRDEIAGSIVVDSDGISVDEDWLADFVNTHAHDYADMPLYFTFSETSTSIIHSFIPPGRKTAKLLGIEGSSAVTAVGVTIERETGGTATTIPLGGANIASLAGYAVVFKVTGRTDQTWISALVRFE